MNCKCFPTVAGMIAIAAVAGSIAFAQGTREKLTSTPPSEQEIQLPPGWTEADMQACMEAGTPGEMHAYLAEGAGVWQGKTRMWMAPGTEPMTSECTSTATPIHGGRFIHLEVKGDMPGMGPYHGSGVYGYNNVTQEFECAWIDNCTTAILTGTGERSYDGSTITWTYNYDCPITKKPTTLREVETILGENARKFEMYSIDPKTGKEFKTMEIQFTRKVGADASGGGR